MAGYLDRVSVISNDITLKFHKKEICSISTSNVDVVEQESDVRTTHITYLYIVIIVVCF